MTFHSLEYLFLFLPACALLYGFLFRRGFYRAGKVVLLVASVAFYCFFSVQLTLCLLGWLTLTYLLGKSQKRLVIGCVIASNLLAVVFYKYFEHSNELVVPLGLSFFAFRLISYLSDARDEISPISFWEFLTFMLFFPTVTAGPLIPSSELIKQTRDQAKVLLPLQAEGIYRFAIGFFEKAVIVHSLMPLVLAGTATPGHLSTMTAWFTLAALTLCVYFDISGYTNMAIGSALLFGIRLPENLDKPFLSTNIADFWQRWHITLTRFFFDYFYFPVARLIKRPTPFKLGLLSVVTMISIGAWFGSGIQFLFFGLLHGLAIAVYHLWKPIQYKLPVAVSRTLTLGFVAFSFVFLFSENVPNGFLFIKALFQSASYITFNPCYALAPWRVFLSVSVLSFGISIIAVRPMSDCLSGLHFVTSTKTLWVAVLCAFLGLLSINSDLGEGFIYVNF